mmetsp:Transcript_13959/g.23129  ORF Transcript_13959/g.23129 Transcript_13959/m.23129 type:complete len:308 (-) Transcript_13959:84-1007(-)
MSGASRCRSQFAMHSNKVVINLLAFLTTADAISVETGYIPVQGHHRVWYKVVRPAPDTAALPPLVVLHGGPQVPSDYLFDIEALGRPVIFYDQLGCGRSDMPTVEEAEYSVEASCADLRCVLRNLLGTDRYHLYGQSWGGLLAAKHVSTIDGLTGVPLTLILSNSPSSVPLVEAEAGRLLKRFDGDVEAFMQAHNCRLTPEGDGKGLPARLAAAYAHAGSTWRGSSAISDLVIDVAAMKMVRCPTLCLRGEHDFVTEACVNGWQNLPDVRFVTIEGCAHHALLEDTDRYLEELAQFLCEHDPISFCE